MKNAERVRDVLPVIKPKRNKLPKAVFDALLAIVGPGNITEDDGVIDGYHNYTTGQVLGVGTMIAPPAVVLPSSTEEVAAIQRVLYRNHLKACPITTNYGAPPLWGGITTKDMIYMDLRRMNKILEIDTKNMYMIVEPFVTSAQCNGELHKIGYTTHCTGPGPTISPLATTTQGWGMGFDSIFMGWSGRNFLGGEWVSPTGEIMSIGAPGWFYPDSPGTSFYGLIRGGMGPLGGLGTFTKCAIKIYPWAGQGEVKTGDLPKIRWQKYGDRAKSWYLTFPSMGDMDEFMYMINKAHIGYSMDKNGAVAAVFLMTDSNDEAYNMLATGIVDDSFGPPKVNVGLLIGAFSDREFQYQLKVAEEIFRRSNASINEDLMATYPLCDDVIYSHLAWNTGTAQGVFKAAGTFYVGMSFMDTTDVCSIGSLLYGKMKKEYEDRGLMLQEGGESNWAAYYEGGTLGGLHTETIWQGDNSDLEQILACNDLFFKACKPWIDHGMTPFWGMHVGHFGPLVGGATVTAYEYRCKIKKTFDAKNVFGNILYALPREDD
ncbi:MAG: FAD-binding oxidoreductase [Desulfomonilia bacterium]